MNPSAPPSDPVHIHIGGATSVETVASWMCSGASTLHFTISRSSRFGLFAEAAALGKIQWLRSAKVRLSADLTFPISQEVDDKAIGLLSSLFGVSLLSYATSVVDSTGADVRMSLLERLWIHVQTRRGEFGDGKRRFVVFRDPDYSVPHCLREGDVRKFPFLEAFSRLLRNIGRGLSGQNGFGNSKAEQDIITFLYESALNSHEHGSPATTTGIRGIIAEKFVSSPGLDLLDRPDIHDIVKSYLRQYRNRNPDPRGFVAFTVADVGAGIHNTLAPLDPESSWNRLTRAFSAGVSRKSPASGKTIGDGTSKIISAAKNLEAFLFVHSSGIFGYYDPTSPEDVGILRQVAIDEQPSQGTALTLVWPLAHTSPDQQSLFPIS